ncbi:hypothetical protein BC828DRAFT_417548 [Blastocladiella britannica]|nr:hypothetical protein BC828DRAFT_417548 [Blastocladiella britannica]
MAGFATIDTCGGYIVVAEVYHLIPRLWTKDCIISALQFCYQILEFLPLPVFPILHMRMVVQLHQYSSHKTAVIASCAGATVVAMLAQTVFTVLLVLTERVPGWDKLFSTLHWGYQYSYNAHMLFVLAMGASSILFILQFLDTITARVVAPASPVLPQPPSSPLLTRASSTPLKLKLQPLGASRSLFEPLHQQHAPADRVTQFNAAVARVRRMSYTSVGMLVVLVGAIVVANLFIVHPLLTQSFLRQCLLASFCLTTCRMRPLMIMCRQLPTVNAGALATDWNPAATASHAAAGPDKDARLTIVEGRIE